MKTKILTDFQICIIVPLTEFKVVVAPVMEMGILKLYFRYVRYIIYIKDTGSGLYINCMSYTELWQIHKNCMD